MDRPVDFELHYVEKLKDIRTNDFIERVTVLLELLSFLGYDQIVDEFRRLDQEHESSRNMGQ